MAKKIVWSKKALNDRQQILSYWRNRNHSDRYSIKLDQLFKEAIRIISEFPRIGKRTDVKDVRIKIVRDYFIIYEEAESEIRILTIWSSHQNPDYLDWTF